MPDDTKKVIPRAQAERVIKKGAKYEREVYHDSSRVGCCDGDAAQTSGAINVSQDGLNFIAQYEGFSSTVYKVGGKGNPTIGFGHEVLPGEDFSGGITRAQGLDLLRSDAQIAVNAINKYVTTPLSQHQFDATASYVFNAGTGNTLYNRKRGATNFLRNLNSGNFRGAASQMDIYTSGGVFMQGLKNRRLKEQNLFLNGKYK